MDKSWMDAPRTQELNSRKKMMANKTTAMRSMFREELLQIPSQKALPTKMKASLGWMCFYMHGLVRNLLLLRQQFSQPIQTLVGGEPLGPVTYEVVVNVAIRRDATLPYQYDDL